MKKLDEIKKGLDNPIQVHFHVGDIEPRLTPLALRDLEFLHTDALAHIQQLETERHQLLTRCERLEAKCRQLERERDALLKDIGSAQGCICIICENYNNPDPGTGTAECNILGRFKDFGSDGALMCDQFKWRGVKEE